MQVVNIKAESGTKHQSDLTDLTGTFFLPANISEAGLLTPEEGNIPWIPRNYLSPVMDNLLIVGAMRDVDTYIASQTKELYDIRETGSWEKYIIFAKNFWKAVNNTNLFGDFLYNYTHTIQPCFLDEYAYIIRDNTISATHHIKKLYEYALTGDEPCNKLYRTITGMFPQKERSLIDNTLTQMLKHAGQMNGSYPISPSQREAVNHFSSMSEGEVLAVNGPPGTGKTTLLQSIVADMLVNRALRKEDAPIIVATSTNNQAVTNIIESFACTNRNEHPLKLDRHWIKNKSSFASYFPSRSKANHAVEKGYQVTDPEMGYTVSKWEQKKNKENSINTVSEYCRKLLGEEKLNLKQCTDGLHQLLSDFDLRRQKMLELSEGIPLEITILSNDLQGNIGNVNKEINACIQKEKEYKERLEEWRSLWRKLFLYRILSFIPYIKKILCLKISDFCSIDEPEYYKDSFTLWLLSERMIIGLLNMNSVVVDYERVYWVYAD